MKVFGAIVKIVIALAAVAGAVYVAATYGDRIVAWAKKLLGCHCGGNCCCGETVEEASAKEPVAEEAAEAPAEEVASEADFEG